MAEWKKVVVSGSSADLSGLTLDTQLAVGSGGTGLTTANLSGQAGKSLAVNVGETGFTFADASAPAGTISASAEGDAQGQIKLNGVNVDINAMQTDDSPQFAGVNIGNASDTTLTRASAGVLAVEGNNVLMASGGSIVSGSGQIVLESADKTGFTGAGSITTVGTLASGNATAIVDAATATAAGKVELATTAEVTTGTDTTRAVTPDGLKDGYQGSGNVTTLGTVTSGDVSAILPSGTVSGSAQIVAGLPSGTVSGSSAGTAQGQFKLNGVDVSVKDLSTTSNVQFANLTATGTTNLNGNVTLGDATTDTVTVNGDLTVKGTASFQNTENLLVKDAFITLNSGSNSATDDGGIIVETSTANGGQGPAFAYNGGDARWGVASLVQSDATSYAADAFMSAVVVGADDSLPTGTYAKKGNIFIGNSENEIWIYGS